MYLYWAIVSPISLGLALFLSAVLTRERKTVGLLFSGIISVFNINTTFNLINTFRRDYNGDISIFPLSNYLAYLVLVNIISLSISVLLLKKLVDFKENRTVQGIYSFFSKLKAYIFMNDKSTEKLISIVLLFCLFYMVGFLNIYIHEFGHGIADIFVGTYYREIGINIYLQGWTPGGAIPFDEFYIIKRTGILLSGLITESIVALFLLMIILKKKEKNNFTWLLSIAISMLFLNRVSLYFTFPQLVNVSSDTLLMVYLGYDPWMLFFIFLPFLIVTFALTFKLMSRFYKTNLERDKKFLRIYFLGLTIYIVVLVVLGITDKYITPLVPLYFY